MTVTVLLFGPLREAVGAPSVTVKATTADEVRDAVAAACPAAAELVRRCAVAVDGEYASGDTPAKGEVALIPPVSGG